MTKRQDGWLLEAWAQILGLAVSLELDASYEERCSILNIP